MTPEQTNKNLDEKLDAILKVLQDFGLNMIQNMGELKHTIEILTDKVSALDKNLIYIKSLGVKLDEVSSIESKLEKQMVNIQSLIKATNLGSKNVIEEPVIQSVEKVDGLAILFDNEENILNFDDKEKLIKEFKELKEKIFLETGGHKVLFEMNRAINDMKKLEKIEDIKSLLLNKYKEWKSNLKN